MLSHSIDELCLLAESNYEKLNKISLGDEFPLASRFKLREKAFQTSKEYFRRFGLTLTGNESKIVVGTGHQPIFYHPGILFKDMVVNALIERGGFSGLNLVVDSDTRHGQLIPIPCLRDGILSLERVELFCGEKNVAAEELPSPGFEEFDAAWDYISQKIERLLPEGNGRTFAKYSEITRDLIPLCNNLPELIVLSRRLFEEEMGFKHAEVFLSSLCGCEEFLCFVSLILVRAKEFTLKYNSVLDQYRAKKGIRHPLTPFPNLKIEAGRLELPFWVWKSENQRSTLYLKFRGRGVEICQDEENILDIEVTDLDIRNILSLADQLGQLAAAGYKLRPKALMLTLFARLFLCDLWIHGVGGAEYEELNNQLAADIFSVSLPPYAVASATLLMGINRDAVVDNKTLEDQIEALRNQLRLMQFNPERFVDPADEEAQGLITERTSLLEEMKRSKGPKGRLHQKVSAINDRLRDRIAPFRQGVESQLRKKEIALVQESIAADREFPFFLYSLNDLTVLYSSLIRKE
ncbi:MAG: hypothetical protein QME81_16645 [bacterium]|nr:hypothetical protein [bacterium]